MEDSNQPEVIQEKIQKLEDILSSLPKESTEYEDHFVQLQCLKHALLRVAER